MPLIETYHSEDEDDDYLDLEDNVPLVSMALSFLFFFFAIWKILACAIYILVIEIALAGHFYSTLRATMLFFIGNS